MKGQILAGWRRWFLNSSCPRAIAVRMAGGCGPHSYVIANRRKEA